MKDSKVSFNKNISKNLRHHSQLFVQCVSILANKKKFNIHQLNDLQKC